MTDQAESDEAFADADLDIDGIAADGTDGGGGAVGGQVLTVSIPKSPINPSCGPRCFSGKS